MERSDVSGGQVMRPTSAAVTPDHVADGPRMVFMPRLQRAGVIVRRAVLMLLSKRRHEVTEGGARAWRLDSEVHA